RTWRKLGEAYLSNSVSDERAIWYMATGLAHGERRPEASEQIEVRRIPIDRAVSMALSGEINDALSLLGLLHYQALGASHE
ncbi:MAG: DNA mismatch repair protein MutT, partial [Acidobacteria bacterium]|nr:DNA mismatch repair protein MutT [Acidobacteriota bacterium]